MKILFILILTSLSFNQALADSDINYSNTFANFTQCFNSPVGPHEADICLCVNVKDTVERISEEFNDYIQRPEIVNHSKYRIRRNAVTWLNAVERRLRFSCGVDPDNEKFIDLGNLSDEMALQVPDLISEIDLAMKSIN